MRQLHQRLFPLSLRLGPWPEPIIWTLLWLFFGRLPLTATVFQDSVAPKANQPVRKRSRVKRKHPVAHKSPIVSPRLREAAQAIVTSRMIPAEGRFLGGDTLAPFFDRLSKSSTEPVHVLQFGDSHTASDDWVQSMRTEFQGEYGSGGPGFVIAGMPRGYRRLDIKGQNSTGWVIEGTVGHPGDERHGLAGMSLTARGPGETISIVASAGKLTLLFLSQPGGGAFALEVDGQPLRAVNTDGELSTGTVDLSPTPGEHAYSLRTLSSEPVRVFGWVSENPTGVTWETLGINGARASMILDWDGALWTEQMKERDPALVILAYGTNESVSPSWTVEKYRETLFKAVTRVKETVPNAAVLLVGPPDCGRLRPFPHLEQIIEIQKYVAGKTGIAFWDWRQHMGGVGSDQVWVRAGLQEPDYIHLTFGGYRQLGQTLASELELEYRQYLNKRTPH